MFRAVCLVREPEESEISSHHHHHHRTVSRQVHPTCCCVLVVCSVTARTRRTSTGVQPTFDMAPCPTPPTTLPWTVLTLLLMLAGVIQVTSSASFRHHGDDVPPPQSRVRRRGSPWRRNSTGGSLMVSCPAEHYVDRKGGQCRPCSPCPVNHIIRRPCSTLHDTRCGPFLEFDRFQQQPGVPRAPDSGRALQAVQPSSRPALHAQRQQGRAEDGGAADLTAGGVTGGRQWRSLSIALIAVLGVVSCCLVVITLFIAFFCRRSLAIKQVVREAEPLMPCRAANPEPRYLDSVVMTRDWPRHLPVYQNSDTGRHVTLACRGPGDDRKVTCQGEWGRGVDQYIYLKCPSKSASYV